MQIDATTARAALDAARAVFGTMTTGNSAGPALSTPAGRALAAWQAAEGILQTVTGRQDLTGQALVGEARRTERLTLGDAHVLIALFGWMERQHEGTAPGTATSSGSVPPTDQERSIAREAMLALEHAVATVQRDRARDNTRDGGGEQARDLTRDNMGDLTRGARAASPYAPPAAGAAAAGIGPSPSSYESRYESRYERAGGSAGGGANMNAGTDASTHASTHANSTAADTAGVSSTDALDAPRRRMRMSPGIMVGALALVLIVGAGLWYSLGRQSQSAFSEGTTAYTRGAREAARIAFARAATEEPDDPRPLIYLGRIAREEGDLPRARRFLERAVRLAPASAIAQREMAATMLADGNPEIARRFYVRALEIDPADRLAQGFLACALHRLGRFDDARRFVERAGPGEWTPCLSTPVAPGMPMPGMPTPGMPMPQPGAQVAPPR